LEWGFGLTMMVMGMAVTLMTLFLLTLVIRLLTKLYPYHEEEAKK